MPLYTTNDAGQLIRISWDATNELQTITPIASIPPSGGGTRRTVADYIASSMRLIQALASGESPGADELTDGLNVFNDMLDSWNTEKNALYTTQPYTFALTPGVQAYTLGDGADFNIPRPPKIERAVLKVTTVPNSPFEIGLRAFTDQEWAGIGLKTIGNTYPQGYWDDGGFPFRTLRFWPIPSVNTSVVLYVWYALSQATATTDFISLPPGYSRALRYNLAVDLAAEFSAPLSPEVLAIALDSKAKIKSLNYVAPLLACDPAITRPSNGWGYYNFLKGE